MIKRISNLIFVFSLLLTHISIGQNTDFPEMPNPPRLVTDFTMTLNQEEINALEQKLKTYSDSTSSQIAIVVLKSIGDYEISQYATELALKWKIGVKGKNNGLLILWATGNRKVYIATGYGFEEKVPDAIAKRIVNQLIIPNFKLGQYYQGLNMATDEIIARMSGQFEGDQSQSEESFPVEFLFIGLLLLFVLLYIIRKNNGGGNSFNNRNRGGFTGGGLPWIISSGGGSSWGGGGSDWGSGDSGGGFGGFGGGDFGGGGAGGDY